MSRTGGREPHHLGKAGIHGNGMIMLEKNSDEVARVIADWLEKAVPEKTAAR
jgi:hypothetical protein